MNQKDRRRELRAGAKQTRPEAGVYRFLNNVSGKYLLEATTNLASIRNKLEWAKSTGTPGALDVRLKGDIQTLGMEAFTLEVLEVVQPGADSTDADLRRDLSTLESLWREKFDASLSY